MRDFDEDRVGRDRTEPFKIGGVEFVARVNVRPEVVARWMDMDPATSSTEALAIVDQTVCAFLDAGDRVKWTALREREDDPVTDFDLVQLVVWLIRVAGSRPTVSSLDFEDGPTSDEDSSTAKSPSTEATLLG